MGKNFLAKLFSGELGWKTVTGAALILVSVVLTALGHQAQGDSVLRMGEALGFVGLRDAFSKLPK